METLVVLVLDESGSMASVKNETISGVNEYIDSLRKTESIVKSADGKIIYTQVNFNGAGINTIYNHLPIEEVTGLTPFNYNPSAATPLYDAIGKTIADVDTYISTFKSKHKKVPSVLFVVMTDGLENVSRNFTKAGIQNLIKTRTRKWTFVYLGANQDAWSVGGGLGFPDANNYTYSTHEMKETFRTLAGSTGAYVANSSKQTGTFWDK